MWPVGTTPTRSASGRCWHGCRSGATAAAASPAATAVSSCGRGAPAVAAEAVLAGLPPAASVPHAVPVCSAPQPHRVRAAASPGAAAVGRRPCRQGVCRSPRWHWPEAAAGHGACWPPRPSAEQPDGRRERRYMWTAAPPAAACRASTCWPGRRVAAWPGGWRWHAHWQRRCWLWCRWAARRLFSRRCCSHIVVCRGWGCSQRAWGAGCCCCGPACRCRRRHHGR